MTPGYGIIANQQQVKKGIYSFCEIISPHWQRSLKWRPIHQDSICGSRPSLTKMISQLKIEFQGKPDLTTSCKNSTWDQIETILPSWFLEQTYVCAASFLPFRTDQGLPWAFGIVGLSSVSGRCEKMGFGQELAPLLSSRPAHYSEHNHRDYGSLRYLPHFDPFYCL